MYSIKESIDENLRRATANPVKVPSRSQTTIAKTKHRSLARPLEHVERQISVVLCEIKIDREFIN